MNTCIGGKRRKSTRRTKKSRKANKSRKGGMMRLVSKILEKCTNQKTGSGPDIEYPNGDKYYGCVDDSKEPNGYGKMIYAHTLDEYVGIWENGIKSGYGTMKLPHVTYEGIWENDVLRHGIITWSDDKKGRRRYEGDLRQGTEQLSFEDNRKLYPYFPSRKVLHPHYGHLITLLNSYHLYPYGQGTMEYISGNVYEGNFNDLPYGKGKMTFSSGNVYEGTFFDGFRHGQGTMIFKNGDIYQGDFDYGEFHGQGSFIETDGHEYQGNWQHNLMSGQGTMRYPNGDVYEGNWYRGDRHGQGEMILANGDRYKCQWENDNCVGPRNYIRNINLTPELK